MAEQCLPPKMASIHLGTPVANGSGVLQTTIIDKGLATLVDPHRVIRSITLSYLLADNTEHYNNPTADDDEQPLVVHECK